MAGDRCRRWSRWDHAADVTRCVCRKDERVADLLMQKRGVFISGFELRGGAMKGAPAVDRAKGK
jgi:hypothetical protein